MNLRVKRTICLMVGIMSILTIVGTISYAYFSAMADMVPLDVGLDTAIVSVVFDDNDTGITGELYFGQSITKKFTLENTGTVDATVRINWLDLVNTYLQGSLTYTLSYSAKEDGTYVDLISDKEVPRTPIPMSLTKVLAESVTIPVGQTYYCNLKITLNNLSNVDQTLDLKAKFYSNFAVEDINAKPELPNFDKAAVTDEGVFELEDDYGTSYYYRGAVTNNYVQFAGFYWRIIRVNGNGSLRIIYDGDQAYANGANSNARFIGISIFNIINYTDAKYVGYMYGPAGTTASTSAAQAQMNTSDSTIKTYIDAWYKTNIVDKGYSNAVADVLFCNDRSTPGKTATGWSSDTGLGYGTNATGYGAYARTGVQSVNYTNVNPTFKCAQKNDAFTVSDTVKGNGALTYPVGLITADEVVAAGSGKFGTSNNYYYLFRPSSWWWTLSPYYFSGSMSSVYRVSLSGSLSVVNVGSNATILQGNSDAVAPVINLSVEYANSLVGDGTMENPYRAE